MAGRRPLPVGKRGVKVAAPDMAEGTVQCLAPHRPRAEQLSHQPFSARGLTGKNGVHTSLCQEILLTTSLPLD